MREKIKCDNCGQDTGHTISKEYKESKNIQLYCDKCEDEARQKTGVKKYKQKKLIGLIFGISIAKAIGFGGFIPYIIGIVFGIWFASQMLNNDKKYLKIIFWVIFILVIILGALFTGMRMNSSYQ